MRQLSTTSLVSAVVLALAAQAALAQSVARPSIGAVAAPAGGAPTTAPARAFPLGGQAGDTVTLVGAGRGVIAIGTPIAPGSAANANGVNAPSGANLQGSQLVDPQGRALVDGNGQPLILDSRGMVGIAPYAGVEVGVEPLAPNTQVMVLNANDLAGSVTSTPELDRATRKELEKAKAASRSKNKQLLNTIAPRTNVDRTDQMADDPISPALSTPERGFPRY